MAPKTKPAFYAVRNGRTPGIYTTWDDARKQIYRFGSPEYKKFATEAEAQAFMDNPQDASEDEPSLVCFTDGSAINNGSRHCKASWAVVWPDHPLFDSAAPILGTERTNNRAEYTAVIKAFEIADTIDPTLTMPLHVHTDSMLLKNSLVQWLPGWKKKNWVKSDKKPVLNADLLQILDGHMQRRRIKVTHVKAHTGGSTWEAIHNDKADRMARVATAL